jgi:hypothetical protein
MRYHLSYILANLVPEDLMDLLRTLHRDLGWFVSQFLSIGFEKLTLYLPLHFTLERCVFAMTIYF